MKAKRLKSILTISLATFMLLGYGTTCLASENTRALEQVHIEPVDDLDEDATAGEELDNNSEHNVVTLNSGVTSKKKFKLSTGHYLVGTGVGLISFVLIFSLFKPKTDTDDYYEEYESQQYNEPQYYGGRDSNSSPNVDYSSNDPFSSNYSSNNSFRNNSDFNNTTDAITRNDYNTKNESLNDDIWNTSNSNKSLFDDDYYKNSLDNDFLGSFDDLFNDDDLF